MGERAGREGRSLRLVRLRATSQPAFPLATGRRKGGRDGMSESLSMMDYFNWARQGKVKSALTQGSRGAGRQEPLRLVVGVGKALGELHKPRERLQWTGNLGL
jgi:hypothetical protein